VLPVGEGLDELDELDLPVVWKPRLLEASRGVRVVTSKAELWDLIVRPPPVPDVEPGEFPYVVQEFVPGEIHDVASCSQGGRPVSMCTHRRVVTRFRHTGPAIVSETTYEPDLMKHARRLLAAMKWNGPALFEFIRGPGGHPVLLEVNARVWGSTQLTVAAGLNVCEQAIDIFVRDRPAEPLTEYEVGLRWKWLTPGTPIRAMASSHDRRGLIGSGDGRTVTNLHWGDFRHLTGMTVESLANRGSRLLHPRVLRALSGPAGRREPLAPAPDRAERDLGEDGAGLTLSRPHVPEGDMAAASRPPKMLP
jgi:ATP-grasp in the biosynthetic pathway with Ter operon